MTRRKPPSPEAGRARHGGPAETRGRRAAQATPPQPAAAQGTAAPAFRRPARDVAILYGTHAVRAALRNPRRARLALYATAHAAERLAADIAASGLVAHVVEAETLTRRLGAQAVHQGLLLEARPLPDADLGDLDDARSLVIVLDQITDPRNVGAILRLAAAFGVDALVSTERHAPEISSLLAKAASGGLEHVALIEVVNLARALDELGQRGFLRVGLDSEAEERFETVPLSRPLALVLGGEGTGLRRLTRTKCDLLARLDMPGAIKSLNVASACAVALTLTTTRLGSSS